MNELTVHGAVLAAAARYGTKVAVEFEGQELTYAVLADQVRRLSGALQHGLGLPTGGRVALVFPNCPEMLIAVVAVSHAGMVSVPIPARATEREVRHMVEDSGAACLLVDSGAADGLGGLLEELDGAGVAVHGWRVRRGQRASVEELIASASGTTGAVQVSGEAPFFFGYTSGTTGSPKAAVVPQRARAAMALLYGQEYGCYTEADTALVTTPLYHGAGLSRGLAPLMTGGSVRLHRRFDPTAVLQALADPAVTAAFMVPTMFAAVFDEAEDLIRSPGDRTFTVLSNASALPEPMKERILQSWPGVRLFEIYGSTEAGTVASLRPEHQRRKVRCVGRPLAMTEVRLVGEDGSEVPAGEIGEIVSRSPFTFSGYHGNPEATAKTVRRGWVGVGDLGRRDEEGYLYIVGRMSEVIITGGVNVYPREVEEVIAAHPAVREVAVVGIADNRWGEQVYAAVIPARGHALVAEDVLMHCRRLLAPQKVPKTVDICAELPRTSSGKVVKAALAAEHSARHIAGRP